MLDILRKRRSIRKYEDRPIATELVEQLKEAALRAPTGNNKREWRFVFVTDREVLGQLAHAKPHWGEFLAAAPLGVVVAADETASDVWIEDCSIAAS
jgi:nitroreductase